MSIELRPTRPAIERMTKAYAIIRAAKQPVTATTLAREFETSIKTIHRDLEFMRERIGLPIVFDAERHTWKTDPAVRLPWWLSDNEIPEAEL